MLSNFGTTEIVVISLLIVVFFGSKKLPEFIKSLGQAVKEFKKTMNS